MLFLTEEQLDKLPLWMRQSYDGKYPEDVVIFYDGDKFLARGKKYNSIEEAYEDVKENLEPGQGMSFDSSIYMYNKGDFIVRNSAGFTAVENTTIGTVRALFPVKNILDSYENTLEDLDYFHKEHAAKYYDNPTGVKECYDFIFYHPAFWRLENKLHSPCVWFEGEANFTYFLEEDKDSPTGVAFVFEYGRSVPPEFDINYFDTALVAYESTWEEAIVVLAYRISQHHHDDGDEKDNAAKDTNIANDWFFGDREEGEETHSCPSHIEKFAYKGICKNLVED